MEEKHYTPVELAKTWGMSAKTVRRLFEDEEDVMRIVRPETRYKRKHTALFISESAARRVRAGLMMTPRCATTRRKVSAVRSTLPVSGPQPNGYSALVSS
jgi:hypothetical protein